MTRIEYYVALEKAIKHAIKLPACIEFYNEHQGWIPLNLNLEDVDIESEFRLYYYIGSYNCVINEHAFDKYYLPMFDYKCKGDVEYRESDVGISVKNLKYIMMSRFEQDFLTNN